MCLLQVDLNHIYGQKLERQHKLRLFKDGKLKHQVRLCSSFCLFDLYIFQFV